MMINTGLSSINFQQFQPIKHDDFQVVYNNNNTYVMPTLC